MSVRQIIERLEDPVPDAHFVAVVGPSGCGKSSLVRAGVVPALRDGASDAPILVTELSPGPHPYDELEAALGAGVGAGRSADGRRPSPAALGG